MKIWKRKAEKETVEGERTQKRRIGGMGRFLKHHKGITFLVCIAVIGSVVGVSIYGNAEKEPPKTAGAAYETMTLEKRDISNSISVTGTIEAIDSHTVTSTLTDGKVEKVNVAVGDKVNAGDVLAVFDDSDLEESLAEAQTSLSVSKAQTENNLEAAERSYAEASETAEISASRASENVTVAYSTYTKAVSAEAGAKTSYQEAVAAEETLEKSVKTLAEKVTKLEKEISELESDLKKSEESEASDIQNKITKKQASLTAAKAEYEEKNAEYKTSQQTTATAKQTYEQAATSLESSYSSYKKAVQDQEDTKRSNESNLAQQASSLENTKLTSSNSGSNEENQVETIQEQIEECTIKAPISGVVTSLSVSEGETFSGGEILTIQDNSSFIVKANVDEYDIADIEKGMSVVIKTDATGDEELEGEVIYVAPTPATSGTSAETTGMSTSSDSSSYEVQISIKTANERLRIGMSAKASILTESREDVFAVPYDAIQTNASGESVIYVVDAEEIGSSMQDGKSEEMSDMDEKSEEMPEMDEKSEEMPEMDEKSDAAFGMERNRKEIVVEVGLESDYYTEIISEELEEGMSVIIGTSTSSSANTENAESENAVNGMFGGMPGGGNAPDGNRGGSAPGMK